MSPSHSAIDLMLWHQRCVFVKFIHQQQTTASQNEDDTFGDQDDESRCVLFRHLECNICTTSSLFILIIFHPVYLFLCEHFHQPTQLASCDKSIEKQFMLCYSVYWWQQRNCVDFLYFRIFICVFGSISCFCVCNFQTICPYRWYPWDMSDETSQCMLKFHVEYYKKKLFKKIVRRSFRLHVDSSGLTDAITIYILVSWHSRKHTTSYRFRSDAKMRSLFNEKFISSEFQIRTLRLKIFWQQIV